MKTIWMAVCLLVATLGASAQTVYSKATALSQGEAWIHSSKGWDYVHGLVCYAMLKVCEQYNYEPETQQLYEWVKWYADNATNEDGSFKNFRKGNIDNIASGKILFELYRHEKALDEKNGTHNADRYKKAATYLRDYLANDYSRIQSGDAKGCFYHKDIYPEQMWLDGLYMGAAFYAEWQGNFGVHDMAAWSDVANQFKTVHRHTYDKAKQLNYHAWANNPEDPNAFWANKAEPFKGCSKEFWGRSMGWFFAALVDVLEVMPKAHPDYQQLTAIANEVAAGIARWQDKESGVWYQLLQYDHTYMSHCGKANYLESSASSMFTYAYLKGMRLGVLPATYKDMALKAYEGMLKTFVAIGEDGKVNLNNCCRSAGLGPAKSKDRDGSADYYLCGGDVRMVSNDGKVLGPFIMASLEYERLKK